MSGLILVTGGSGYFGSLLIGKLLVQGHRVRNFDLNAPVDGPRQVEFFQGDIRDAKAIRKACEGVSVVHHNVAQVPLAKDKYLFRSVNIDGMRNLLQAAHDLGLKKVVYTSSSAVFGVPASNPVLETTPPKPGEAYGQAKFEAEQLCQSFCGKGLDVTIVRPRTILGHGRLGIFQILFEWISEGVNIPVLGKGDNVYQFVHADDLAQACIAAGERPGSTIYNCGAREFGSMRNALESLCGYARTGSRVRSVPMKPAILAMKITSLLGFSPLGAYHALMYGRSMYFDISKACHELNWRPKHSNESMLQESYQWYLDHRAAILSASGGSPHRTAVKQGILRLLKWFL